MTENQDSISTCEACGAAIFPGATDCPACGRLVTVREAPQQEALTTPVRQWPFRSDVGLLRYSLRAALVAATGSAVVAILALTAARLLGLDLGKPPDVPVTPATFFVGVVVAPLLETLLLAGLLHFLSHWLKPWPLVATTSAVVFGVLHGTMTPIWFFGTVWSFFVFSAAYLAWQGRRFREAYLAAALPHAFLNLAAMSMVGVSSLR